MAQRMENAFKHLAKLAKEKRDKEAEKEKF